MKLIHCIHTAIISIVFLLITTSATAQFGIGGTLTTGIDLLRTPILNSERVFAINGNAFTLQPALYYTINDNTSVSVEAGLSLGFMSKNNSRGEVDRDLALSFPVMAKVNFGSAANTGSDCELWGWYGGVGRQWYNDFQIHGTTTTPYATYFGELGGTVNATSPIAIGGFGRYGISANGTWALQLGLVFTYNHVKNGCE